MISMDKKYKYRNGESARILCVDRQCPSRSGQPAYAPVISLSESGSVMSHMADGTSVGGFGPTYDLIEVKPKIRVTAQLFVFRSDGIIYTRINMSSTQIDRMEADWNYELIGIINIDQEIEDGHNLFCGEATLMKEGDKV